jgi:FAD/FMN-containing dehydrogenase
MSTQTNTSASTARVDVPDFRGVLIEPGDADYDSARAVYNGNIDRRPRVIAQCMDVADVIAAVRSARERGLTIAVRGGGHHAAGLGVWDDALVIDLSRMRAVHVSPDDRVITVEGGATWGDVDHACHPFGLSVPSGFISSTGVGGLTLGGGVGYLTRQFGFTVDSLIAADVVLADGSFVTADAEHHADLFWALRGGGGNFGVVTAFTFRGRPVRDVIGGPMFFDFAASSTVMQAWNEFIGSAPEQLDGWFGFLTVPDVDAFPDELRNQKVCAIVWCYNGSQDEADALLAPMRALDPVLDGVGPLPFPAMQSMFDAIFPAGLQWYWRADFVDDLTEDAVAVHLDYAARMPTAFSTMHLYPIDGAAHRIGVQDTAFPHRGSRYAQVIVGVDPDPANVDMMRDWVRAYHDALRPYAAKGGYANMLNADEIGERIEETYQGNLDRLVQVKQTYDPDNTFHINANIAPDTA